MYVILNTQFTEKLVLFLYLVSYSYMYRCTGTGTRTRTGTGTGTGIGTGIGTGTWIYPCTKRSIHCCVIGNVKQRRHTGKITEMRQKM
jgi:hypothetical protein